VKRPRAITPKSLENSAAHYLERYSASEEGLRRVLQRRLHRARRAGAEVPEEAPAWIEAVIARFATLGIVDDRAFAETKARSLHRRGSSSRATSRRLKSAGVDGDTAQAALAALDQELGTDPVRRERQAAIALARRRRLGPFRPPAERADRRLRDLAAMARGGFSYELARQVIDAASPEALDEE